MTIIDSISQELKTAMEADSDLMDLVGDRIYLKYVKLEGDRKFPYFTFDHVETGLVDEWPISKGFLRIEVWTFSEGDYRTIELIISRLKQLFHKKIWKNTTLKGFRTFYQGSGTLTVSPPNPKLQRAFVRFESRFYDTDLQDGLTA